MAGFNTLPYEIQQLILQHIDSTKQLGECRLVSKIWDEPAECAMFSRQLLITRDNTRSLCELLVTKPSRAKHIKEICFWFDPYYTELMVASLRLAITPSIEKVTTSAFDLDDRFYQTLTQIARDSGMRLDRLKSIPWPYRFNDTHYQTALFFKDSLEDLIIPASNTGRPHEISYQLDEFKHLSKLQVQQCVFDTLAQVETIFGGASHLMKVELRYCHFDEGNVWPHEQRLQWMDQHVQISKNAIIFNALDARNLSIPLIEFFLVKYPKMRQFDYDASGLGLREAANSNVEINRQTCLWISRIPKYTINLSSQHEWRAHYASFAGDNNAVHLYYVDPSNPTAAVTRVSSTVEQDGNNRTTQFEFRVNNVHADTLDNVLQDVGAFAKHIHIHFYSHHSRAIKSRVFFRALQVMNRLEGMKFESSSTLESVELDLQPQYSKRRINTLKIICDQIQPQVFHLLDRLFETIITLKLVACFFKLDKTSTVCIHMPSTALGKVTFATNPFLTFSELSSMHSNMYFMITLQQKVTLYFNLKPHSSNAQQVSFTEYSSRPQDAKAFKIDCLLLASIQLDLYTDDDTNIRATIDVQKYCEELGITFN